MFPVPLPCSRPLATTDLSGSFVKLCADGLCSTCSFVFFHSDKNSWFTMWLHLPVVIFITSSIGPMATCYSESGVESSDGQGVTWVGTLGLAEALVVPKCSRRKLGGGVRSGLVKRQKTAELRQWVRENEHSLWKGSSDIKSMVGVIFRELLKVRKWRLSEKHV